MLRVENQAVDKPNEFFVMGAKCGAACNPAVNHPVWLREQCGAAWQPSDGANLANHADGRSPRRRECGGKRSGEGTRINHVERDKRHNPPFQVPVGCVCHRAPVANRTRHDSIAAAFDSRRCVDSPGNKRSATRQASRPQPGAGRRFSRARCPSAMPRLPFRFRSGATSCTVGEGNAAARATEPNRFRLKRARYYV